MDENAGVAELVDACDSKSHVFGRVGSSPTSGTSEAQGRRRKSACALFFVIL